mgnify:CR=1 FL=1
MVPQLTTVVLIMDFEKKNWVLRDPDPWVNTQEKSGNFVIVFSGKEIATVTSFEAALEEAIMAYNLSI